VSIKDDFLPLFQVPIFRGLFNFATSSVHWVNCATAQQRNSATALPSAYAEFAAQNFHPNHQRRVIDAFLS
jgi:hypothetical protein